MDETLVLDRARAHARAVLTGMRGGVGWTAAVLYAAAATERLFRWYDARPAAERAPYSETWRPCLAAIWDHAAGVDGSYRRISDALGHFYLSEYSNDGYDGPPDIDEDEAAATYYAAHCVMHGLVDYALMCGTRATDKLDYEYSYDDRHRQAMVFAELDRQAADLALIADFARGHTGTGNTAPAALITRLREP